MDDKHASLDDSRLRDSRNPNVFDDEYEVDRQDVDRDMRVADGLRPSPANAGSSAAPGDRNADSLAIPTKNREMDNDAGPSSARNSAFVESQNRNSFAVLHDGQDSSSPDPQAATAPQPQKQVPTDNAISRHISTASSSSFMTAANSQAPSGPSHPYGMYPQGTGVSRTASVATSSTVRPSQRLQGASGPSHPYNLYPQNVVEGVEENESSHPQLNIPVGFGRMATNYHRRIGPDGEEQDIIGPDGHTEQLPPYSLHPTDVPKSAYPTSPPPMSIPVSPPASDHSSQDVLFVREPSVSSPNTTTIPQQPDGERQISEKSWREKSWAEKRRTKVLFGKVPLWLVLVLFSVILVCAIILGAAIGTVVAREDEEEHSVEAVE